VKWTHSHSKSEGRNIQMSRNCLNASLPNGKVIDPTGKAFDVEFGETVKWDGDQLIEIAAFWHAALQAQQLGLA